MVILIVNMIFNQQKNEVLLEIHNTVPSIEMLLRKFSMCIKPK